MEENTELMTADNIRNRVYTIRGQQVMLDYDLADIYGYEVKRLNEQVKRNIARFPEDFMFQLEKEEIPEDCLKSQIVTLNENGNKRGLHIKKMPYAFTEQGIYMLATVLRGELAEQQSIFIMRAFREMHLVTAKVSEMSVQVAGITDWKRKTEQAYHCGASSKDAGKKLCAINEIENTAMIHPVMDGLLLGADKII